MLERTYDGLHWEEVSEQTARHCLELWYNNIDLLFDTMRSTPDYQARGFGAYYRWREEDK